MHCPAATSIQYGYSGFHENRGLSSASLAPPEFHLIAVVAKPLQPKAAALSYGASPLNTVSRHGVRSPARHLTVLAPLPQQPLAERSASRLLTLDGGPLQYEVRTVSADRPGVTAAYLEYADRMHQLNYLLHPGPILPEARLALNQSLRGRDRLPAQVELRAEMDPPLRMRAEHSLHFDLNGQDRALIHQWESQLKSSSVREVPLREYQRTIVAAASRRAS